ncbi:hypothetical protein LS633_11845 [Pseudomonas sp. NIBR-H-19]|uniref:hypothetical protein n=1 Tax=Pseudomonas sp. NIBR-H-19 TaxID=2901380 RepID=UPI001E4FDF2D|nr:hypothetical protein [Pseudomonas sp. NIBR-H-19]UHC84455.1 hypothetical protein LS633_11845 [Pseudomonas sp. NIBR-H-19]
MTATEFIQSTVASKIRGAIVELPPVVGRSFAHSIARLIQADFPNAFVTTIDRHHTNQMGLKTALEASDLVSREVLKALATPRPGERILTRLGCPAVLSAGGVQ